ncbi:MAG: hypothetical protein J6X66_03890 [Lachnospiraceae bacterium]|nr:hypothetical protein [Lachnospiraceae bacterium]
MRIIDTSGRITEAFDNAVFSLDKWKVYMDQCIPAAKDLCLKDMQDCIDAGFTWDKDFMPVLNAVYSEEGKRKKAVDTFRSLTENLEERILEIYHRSVEADIILYLGLCNGAGWVCGLSGRTTVLLGIEKIIELGWLDERSMTGLLFHELGHVYQAQYGRFKFDTDSMKEHFLWKLFTEGVAMVFEQELVGDSEFYQQDVNGWKDWCEGNYANILSSFVRDLQTMTPEDQRYFGDWVSFEGRGDTGYFLGTKFVRYLQKSDEFDRIISYDIDTVKEKFKSFCDEVLR